MCGRYKIERIAEGWSELDGTITPAEIQTLRNIESRLDVRPTQTVPVVRWAKNEPTPRLVNMRWGFIPVWWRNNSPPQSSFNSRSEEAPAKPMWGQTVKQTRCLIPATGWYEWVPVKAVDDGAEKRPRSRPLKTPIELHAETTPTLCFAGLWNRTHFRDEAMETCTILTRAAVTLIAEHGHDRMPIVASPASYHAWLDPAITDLDGYDAVVQSPVLTPLTILDRGPPVVPRSIHGTG